MGTSSFCAGATATSGGLRGAPSTCLDGGRAPTIKASTIKPRTPPINRFRFWTWVILSPPQFLLACGTANRMYWLHVSRTLGTEQAIGRRFAKSAYEATAGTIG